MISYGQKKVSTLTIGKNIVLAGGCFDVFHYGHYVFLKKARAHGDCLVILLESDEFIEKKKKRQPIHTQSQRAEILSAVRFVDVIIKLPYLHNDSSYKEVVKAISPRVIAVTQGDTQMENKEMQAREIGAEVKVVTELLSPFSTSHILSYATVPGR